MEKVFIITDKYQLSNISALKVNKFLEENPDYGIKHIVPLTQHSECGYYGVVITVSKK